MHMNTYNVHFTCKQLKRSDYVQVDAYTENQAESKAEDYANFQDLDDFQVKSIECVCELN